MRCKLFHDRGYVCGECSAKKFWFELSVNGCINTIYDFNNGKDRFVRRVYGAMVSGVGMRLSDDFTECPLIIFPTSESIRKVDSNHSIVFVDAGAGLDMNKMMLLDELFLNSTLFMFVNEAVDRDLYPGEYELIKESRSADWTKYSLRRCVYA